MEQDVGFTEQLALLVERWDATNELAESTSSNALSGPIGDLQDIKLDVETLDAPDCAQELQETAMRFMSNTIDLFLVIMSGDVSEAEARLRAAMVKSELIRDDFDSLLTALTLDEPRVNKASYAIYIPGPKLNIEYIQTSGDVATTSDLPPWFESIEPEAGNKLSVSASYEVGLSWPLSCILIYNGKVLAEETVSGLDAITCEGVAD